MTCSLSLVTFKHNTELQLTKLRRMQKLSKLKRRFGGSRSLAVWAVSIAMCTPAHSQNQQPTPTSPEAVAAQMWKKIVSVCPIPGTGGTATFFAFSLPSISVQNRTPIEYTVEYRDAWTKFFVLDVSPADRLNGIQFLGYAILSGPLYRIYADNEWSEWKDGVSKKAADTLRPNSRMPDRFALNGSMEWTAQVVIEERGGRWFFSYFGVGPNRKFNPDEVAAKRKSCDALLR